MCDYKHVPGTILSAGDTWVNKMKSAFMEFTFLSER